MFYLKVHYLDHEKLKSIFSFTFNREEMRDAVLQLLGDKYEVLFIETSFIKGEFYARQKGRAA